MGVSGAGASPLCLSARRPSERLSWRPGQRPIIRAAIIIYYFVLTGRRGLSCSPNLEYPKMLSCRLTPLQRIIGMIPSSRGPDLAVAAAQRQALEDGNAMPSLAD